MSLFMSYVHGSPLVERPIAFKPKEFAERTSEVLKRAPLRSMGRTIAVRVLTRSTRKGT